MNNKDTLLAILRNISYIDIGNAMKAFARVFGEPDYGFHCCESALDCWCGMNCGENDDCFACGENEVLDIIEWCRRETEEEENE